MKDRKIVGANRRRGAERRAEQLSRVQVLAPKQPWRSKVELELLKAAMEPVVAVIGPKRMRCQRNSPSARGDKKRQRCADLADSMMSVRGCVINAWSAARRRNWNGKGKLRGGAKDIDWSAALRDMRKRGQARA